MLLRLCVIGALLACVFAGAAQATAKSEIREVMRRDYRAGVTKNGADFCAVRTFAARKRIVQAYANLGKKGTCAVAATYILKHNATLSPERLTQIRRAIENARITVHPARASVVSAVGLARFLKLKGRWYIDYISWVS